MGYSISYQAMLVTKEETGKSLENFFMPYLNVCQVSPKFETYPSVYPIPPCWVNFLICKFYILLVFCWSFTFSKLSQILCTWLVVIMLLTDLIWYEVTMLFLTLNLKTDVLVHVSYTCMACSLERYTIGVTWRLKIKKKKSFPEKVG